MAHEDNPLTGLSVLDHNGVQVLLASLWRDRSAMLVFVRHFGCLFCQEQVGELQNIEQPLHELATDLVVIGNGAPHFISGFRERSGYRGQIYTDPNRATFAALGLRRDLRSSLNLKTIGRGLAAFGAGSRQSSVQGDPWQQGGIVLIRSDGSIAYRYASAFAGGHPPSRVLLEQARTAHERTGPSSAGSPEDAS